MRRDRNETIFVQTTELSGLSENAENAISCRRPGSAIKKRHTKYASRREEEEDAQTCPCGKAIE